jgi:hypothetical protein
MTSSLRDVVSTKEPTMNEILTLDEIQSRYDSEWVLVEDPELSKNLEVVRGKVVWHSKDRDEVYAKALELRPKHPAFLYMGAPPQDMEYVL